jgi:uncharacterized phage protein gp47/JayE
MAISGYIDETGIHIPTYDEILSDLKTSMRSIYGADLYLEADSQDGQALGIFALAISDAYNFGLQVYNSFSPQTAQGVGLSQQVAINGIRRKVATYSTADVVLVGTAGTVITNGIAEDVNSRKWALPATVTIPPAGTITVTATAVDIGDIFAGIGEINKIFTPTRGWQSVTNPAASTVGAPIESDPELRLRQEYSTAIPSQTVFSGMIGAIASLNGVGRIKGYENNTASVDTNGIPAHSLAFVVEGGDVDEIAYAIATKKTPGIPTYGTITKTIIDEHGQPITVQFSRPVEKDISVVLTLKPLTGYTSDIANTIRENVFDYLNTREIGESVYMSDLFSPANDADPAKTFYIASVEMGVGAETPSAQNIVLAYNDLAVCLDIENITIVEEA